MRNRVWVRPVTQADWDTFREWWQQTEENEYDPAVLTYPSTATLCAFNQEGPLVYMPIQQPFMLESLAIKPGADPLVVAEALRQLMAAAITQSFIKGAGEIYFVATNEATEALARHQMFEKVPWNVYRVKVRDLEKK